MASCREIDALVTPFVDGEATSQQRMVVEAHLSACPVCRHRAEAESAARQTMRLQTCCPNAPEQLRKRCSKAATPIGRLTCTYSPSQLSMFAAVVVVLGGASVYGVTRVSPTVLAAQLTLDHLSCFALHRDGGVVDAAVSESKFAEEHGWRPHVPTAPASDELQLVGVRRCFCAEGAAVHIMYRHRGEPVSLYLLPRTERASASTSAFGRDALIWSESEMTYVLLGREPESVLKQLAADLN